MVRDFLFLLMGFSFQIGGQLLKRGGQTNFELALKFVRFFGASLWSERLWVIFGCLSLHGALLTHNPAQKFTELLPCYNPLAIKRSGFLLRGLCPKGQSHAPAGSKVYKTFALPKTRSKSVLHGDVAAVSGAGSEFKPKRKTNWILMSSSRFFNWPKFRRLDLLNPWNLCWHNS